MASPHPDPDRFEEDDALGTDEGEEYIDVFIEESRVDGRDDTWLDEARYCLSCLLAFKQQQVDTTLSLWDGRTIRAFLLDHYPRKLRTEPGPWQLVPEILVEFFRWMRHHGIISANTRRNVTRQVQRSRRMFMERAADPGYYSPEKRVFTQLLHQLL
ncbi:MAG: hypothetical protein AB2A00_24185 [Myxococcota bacterium]